MKNSEKIYQKLISKRGDIFMNKKEKTLVSELNIKNRTRKLLEKNGLKTVEDIMMYTEGHPYLMKEKIKGFKEKDAGDLYEALKPVLCMALFEGRSALK